MGGKCCLCGYNKCNGALEFHHINPQEKEFGICTGVIRALEIELEEIKKCVLVCANCHREIHAGMHDNIILKTTYNDVIAQEELNKVIQTKTKRKRHYYCNNCGKELSGKANLCVKCNNLFQRKAERPNRDELKQMIRDSSFTAIGEIFGVSYNTVKNGVLDIICHIKKKI